MQYIIIKPTRKKFKSKLARAALRNKLLLITARECLDDLTARRRQPEVVDFKLRISSIHPSDGAFVIAEMVEPYDAAARLDVEADSVIMTVISSEEHPVATP